MQIGLFSTVRLASRDTLRRWTRDVVGAAGIDLTVFSPHFTRSASSSKAALRLSLSTIVSTVDWAGETPLTRHYRKPIAPQGQFVRAVLSSRVIYYNVLTGFVAPFLFVKWESSFL